MITRTVFWRYLCMLLSSALILSSVYQFNSCRVKQAQAQVQQLRIITNSLATSLSQIANMQDMPIQLSSQIRQVLTAAGYSQLAKVPEIKAPKVAPSIKDTTTNE